MSAVAATAQKGGQHAPSSAGTFRSLMDARRAEGRRLSLDDVIAVLVPVCVDLKERHARGETLYVHPSAIGRSPDGLMRVQTALATPPRDARDKASLAPELVKSGQPGNGRASVFAIGAMLYEAVTGSPVGPGMRRPRDVDPSLPESLEVLLGKALVANPANRPDDIGALASAMHHLAPMKSIPPPDADLSNLDRVDGNAVDVRMSLLPPVEVQFSLPPPSGEQLAAPAVPQIIMPGGGPTAAAAAAPAAASRAPRDPTKQLVHLKARLESDPRPRYVVNKDRMDHGPFNAVELLQQIASNHFRGEDGLRDELTGVSQKIDEWEEFAPFAQHARMHREIAQEKREVAKVEKAEKKAGAAKVIIGAILAVALLGILIAFVVKKVGSRKDGEDLSDDPNAVDLSGGGSVGGAGGKKVAKGGRGGRGGGAGGPGGASYDDALNQGSDLSLTGGGGPDLTNAQLHAPMANGGFISACGAPNDMHVTVRTAVKLGRAVGVSVSTNPPNAAVAACVDRHVRGLAWPSSPKMDSFTTTY
jgi:hypothetical protein